MRPRLPPSLSDLAWLVCLLPIAIFGGLVLVFAGGLGCDGPCSYPFKLELAAWIAGVAAALAAFWAARPRPLLALATAGLLVPIVRAIAVIAQ